MARLIKCDVCGKIFPDSFKNEEIVNVTASCDSMKLNLRCDVCKKCYEDLSDYLKTIRKNHDLEE